MQFFSKPQEELKHLQIQFKATQRLSLQVQKELEQFIFEYHVGENEIFSGVRYKDYLAEMKKSFRENLSDEIFNRAISFKLSKSNIYSMTKSLETQFEALSQIHINLTLLLNNVTSRTTSGSARIFSLTKETPSRKPGSIGNPTAGTAGSRVSVLSVVQPLHL